MIIFILLLLMDTLAETARRSCHGLVPTMGVSATGMPSVHSSCESQVLAVSVDFLQSGPSGGLLKNRSISLFIKSDGQLFMVVLSD